MALKITASNQYVCEIHSGRVRPKMYWWSFGNLLSNFKKKLSYRRGTTMSV